MSARRIAAVTRRLLAQLRRDRRTLALLFVVPIVILSLLGYLLRGGGSNVAMGVVNQDQGPAGALVAKQLDASTKVDARTLSLPDARSQLRDGKLAGYAVFPADFTAAVARSRTVRPELYLEGSQPGPSGSVEQALATALQAALSQQGGARLTIDTHYLYGGPGFDTLDYFGPGFVGLVVFFLVFVVTSVAFLRERSGGTLERLMASPIRRSEIVLGYMLAFTLLALVQSAIVLVFSLYVLNVANAGNVGLVFLLEGLMAISAVNTGIFLSAFASTEFQAVQFIPLVIVPQLLLSGILFPVSTEPGALQPLSNVLPLTYAVYGLRDVMIKGDGLGSGALQLDLAVVLAFAVVMLVLATATLRRRVA